MENRSKNIYLAILALALVFAMAAVGCGSTDDGNDPALNGTWIISSGANSAEIKFSNGKFESSLNGKLRVKGTYDTNDNWLYMYPTHYHGDYIGSQVESKWYTKKELEATGLFAENTLNSYFAISTSTYSVSGNTFTFATLGGGGGTYTKK